MNKENTIEASILKKKTLKKGTNRHENCHILVEI